MVFYGITGSKLMPPKKQSDLPNANACHVYPVSVPVDLNPKTNRTVSLGRESEESHNKLLTND